MKIDKMKTMDFIRLPLVMKLLMAQRENIDAKEMRLWITFAYICSFTAILFVIGAIVSFIFLILALT